MQNSGGGSNAPEQRERQPQPRPAAPEATVTQGTHRLQASGQTCSLSSCLSVCRSVACILPAQDTHAITQDGHIFGFCHIIRLPASRLASDASSSSART
jgi:hypothetical protein